MKVHLLRLIAPLNSARLSHTGRDEKHPSREEKRDTGRICGPNPAFFSEGFTSKNARAPTSDLRGARRIYDRVSEQYKVQLWICHVYLKTVMLNSWLHVIIYDNMTHCSRPVGFCRRYSSIRALYASPRGCARRSGEAAHAMISILAQYCFPPMVTLWSTPARTCSYSLWGRTLMSRAACR